MRKTFLATTALAVAMACPGLAFAQEAPSDSEPSTDEADDVIIVTATRRAENVQDIPIAVTAVSPAQLERQGVDDVSEIVQVAPSFSTSNAQVASGSVVLRIRGVGTTSNNIGFESAVGIFIDGAYQSRPGVALNEFVDIERVEVLRGPQGTLFGRNTSAGALNITNKRPDLSEFGGFANATYGNRDLISVQGAINAPIVQDTLALRVTGAYRERDGYVTVVDRNGTPVGESNGSDQWLLRGQLGFESDSGIRGRLIADYTKSTAGCCSPIELGQSGIETAGIFNAVGLGARGGMAGPAVAVNPFDTTSARAAAEARIATANFAPIARTDQWGITGEIEIPVGSNADLIYIGSYREYESFEAYDSDFSGLDVFDIDRVDLNIDTMTHELRLQGEAWGGRVQWMIGGYYSKEDIVSQNDASLGSEYDQFAGALLAASTIQNAPGLAPFGGAFGPSGNIASPLAFLSGTPFTGASVTNQYTQSSESWSLFTHNVFEITDGLKLTLGLRYSDESKTGGFSQLAANNPTCAGFLNNGAANLGGLVGGLVGGGLLPASQVGNLLNGRDIGNGEVAATGLQSLAFVLSCFPFVAPADLPAAAVLPLPRTFPGPFSNVGSFKDDELIYTVKGSYEFDFPVTIYASFTHGYKSGGFNLDSTAASGGADPTFASEEVDAYEAGMKGSFIDDAVTLNLAVFHEEFTNFQVLEFTGSQFSTFNVPLAKSTGVEIETVIRPSREFTVNGGVTILNARYPGNCASTADSLTVRNLCGNSLTNAPDIVAILGATWEKDLGSNLDFFLNGQMRFEDDRRTSTQARNVPANAANLGTTPLLPFDVQDSNIKINLRAGIGSQDDLWQIEGFVTNLTNEITRGVTFNTTLRSDSRSAFIQEPRSYGITVRSKF